MTTITIDLPDAQLQQLKEVATRLKIAPEELIRASLEELLAHPEERFQHALEYVIHKNDELYQRLA